MTSPHRIYVGKDGHKFSAAHMTVFADGSKERLHGHNFRVRVGVWLKDVSFASFLDFGVVKRALEAQCQAWDEYVILAERSPHHRTVRNAAGELEFILCGRRYVMPADEAILLPIDNMTVEALSVEFARQLVERLRPQLPPEVVAGLDVDISESDGQGATYHHPL